MVLDLKYYWLIHAFVKCVGCSNNKVEENTVSVAPSIKGCVFIPHLFFNSISLIAFLTGNELK